MTTPKHKHLTFEDRCVIQEFLNHGYSFTAIGHRIKKDRRTVSREVLRYRYLKFADATSRKECPFTAKVPYVCNACLHKRRCRHNMYLYEAHIAQMEYTKTISDVHKSLHITKDQIAEINETIAPLMVHNHHSVNHVYAAHGDMLPFSKSTFYRYIDAGVINVCNIDLRRKVRFKIKKSTSEVRAKPNTVIKVGRFYRDFIDYISLNPEASIVEMDTVIGTSGGKGGKCMLTLLFRKSHLMLIYLLPYKRQEYVTKVFNDIKEVLGDETFSKLFEVILTDNGTEFLDPLSIEVSIKTGEKLVNVFYCDPNCSWQKGRLEKNHEYIRYILPKGTSFAGLSQEDCSLIASHINSVPRDSLNYLSPYEVSHYFINEDTMNLLRIQRIPNDEIDLSRKLLTRSKNSQMKTK